MNRKHAYGLALLSFIFASLCVKAQQFQLELAPINFVLPAFSEEYSDREVTLAPDEYELAEKLKSLLDKKDYKQVRDELVTYYNIELSPALLMIKAQVYFSLKEYSKAIKVYEYILKRKPQLVRAHEDLGQLYLFTEQLYKAQTHFAKAISYGSNNAMVHGQLGYLNLQSNGAFSALYAYQKAYSLEPNNRQWQQGLLTSLVQAKMFPSALALLEEFIEKDTLNQSLWLTKAAINLEQKQNLDALQSLEYALLLGELPHQNKLVMINLHFEQSHYDRAMSLLKSSAKENKVKFSEVGNYLYRLNAANRWSDSEWLLNHFADSDTLSDFDKSTLAYTQAQILEAKGKLTQASKYYADSLQKNANNSSALLSYAYLKLQQKNFILSEQLFIRAQSFENVKLQAMLGRAQLYINTDDIQAAYNLLLDVNSKYPETQGLQDKIEILANITKIENTNKL
ncbi:tetratricopeptide repeat protein [Pseudoalteromonas luteoviolacea]|uniref:tetratricopeptide repeat protein n=1 Tax=Pseudoalteromonas luteoviolacea TaxID=43657 RepID=UPI00163B7062|nr:tetratricopeptide repeat protein [Pseudoalteromonas luteoviolacea]